MRKKLVPLFAIAFVVAVISTAVFYSIFAARLNGEPSGKGPQSGVVVAARDLASRTVVSASDVRLINWSGEVTPSGVFSAPEQVVGKTLLQPLGRGEPVTEARLAGKDGTGSGVPEGMRAVSVHVSDSSGVVALLKPGFKVDVQMFASRSPRAAATSEMTTLLRGATVLAINPQPEQSSQGYFAAPVVTLVASARDAEQLALADSFARLRLTLRNPLEAAGEPPPARSVPAGRQPAFQVRFKAIRVTDEGLAALAGKIDVRLKSGAMTVVAARECPDFGAVTQLLASGDWTEARPESLVSVVPGTPSWYLVTSEQGRARIGLVPLNGGSLRVRSEVTGMWNGREEVRSVETAVDTSPRRVIVVSGLSGDPSRFRHLVVLISAQPRASTAS